MTDVGKGMGLVEGEWYDVNYKAQSGNYQWYDYTMTAQYLGIGGAGGHELLFSLRPIFGTQELNPDYLLEYNVADRKAPIAPVRIGRHDH